MYDLRRKRVWVAGHNGMVGRALVRRLAGEECDILTAGRDSLDLLDQSAVRAWMARERPDAIFLAAARVGGILANDSAPADFLYDNLMIEANVIEAAHREDVEKLCFLGSSCIYPKFAEQPIAEESLLAGPLEPTNQWYAVAKIAGIKLAQAYRTQHGRDFISAMPTNLYGPGDNFDPLGAHVIPAMMRRFHEAKVADAAQVVVWGTGSPRREFLHVDDLADALLLLMRQYEDPETINVGTGQEVTIRELAETMAHVVGYTGALKWDTSKPDGTPRKLLDSSRIQALGWKPKRELKEALASTYQWALEGAIFREPLVTSRERGVIR